MRHPFGRQVADYAISAGDGETLLLATGAVITMWDSQTDGTQITDLSLAADGSSPVTSVTTSDGTDGLAPGMWPTVYGPDAITSMWAQAGDAGPRVLLWADDLGDRIDALEEEIAALGASFVIPFSVAGEVSVMTGQSLLPNASGVNRVITSVQATVGTPPTGNDLIVQVLVDGTPISDAITIGDGTQGSPVYTFTAPWNIESLISVDVTQVGPTTPGSDLLVAVWVR